MENKKHICGQCGLGFDTDEQYCDHECVKTGFTPKQPEHLGEEFVKVSETAQKRGAEKKANEAKKPQ